MASWSSKKRVFGRFIEDEAGQSTTEYILLLALVIVPVAAAIEKLKDPLINFADAINRLLDGPGL